MFADPRESQPTLPRPEARGNVRFQAQSALICGQICLDSDVVALSSAVKNAFSDQAGG